MINTERLRLRRWKPEDREPFAAMNADPQVTEFLGGCLTREGSDRIAERIEAHFARHSFGLFAAELKSSAHFGSVPFIGYVGLAVPGFEASFQPCVEIGWRLAVPYWNLGLATEGARAVLDYAFSTVGLEEVLSFTVPANVRSRRVMEKLGLTHDPADDFDHPGLPAGHPLRRHVLYRIRKPHSRA
jgi:RimJ/RimL family protein N-acetyltransferase